MPPAVSVIVPSYNRAGFLAPTLESILSQSLPPAEVILVDDGSTDGTATLVSDRFQGRVRYLRIENSGVCVARNKGVEASLHPWIAFCDSDDLWAPDRLQRQFDLVAAAPDVEYVVTNFRYVTDEQWSPRDKFSENPSWQATLHAHQIAQDLAVIRKPLYATFLQFGAIFPSTLLMTRRRFEAMHGFDQRWTRTSIEDLDFTMRCMQFPPFGFVTQPLVGIRRHDSNASGNRLRDLRALIEILNAAKTDHELGRSHASLLDAHVAEASSEAAELAFAARQFELVHTLLRPVGLGRLSQKMRLKKLIAALPEPARSFCGQSLLDIARLTRGESP